MHPCGRLALDHVCRKINKLTNVVETEEHRFNNLLHRAPSEGPAVIIRDPKTGNVAIERFYVNGKIHRDDGPAEIHFGESGRIVFMAYYKNGRMHRDYRDGPALIIRDEVTGRVEEEGYFSSGTPHRHPADGPAKIYYPKEGPVQHEHHYRGNYVDGDLVHLPAREAIKVSAARAVRLTQNL